MKYFLLDTNKNIIEESDSPNFTKTGAFRVRANSAEEVSSIKAGKAALRPVKKSAETVWDFSRLSESKKKRIKSLIQAGTVQDVARVMDILNRATAYKRPLSSCCDQGFVTSKITQFIEDGTL